MAFARRYGPWALVTGASSGIGLAFAEEAARRGLNVALTARRGHRLEETADRLRTGHGVETLCLPADLTEARAVPGLVAALAAREVGLLVNNAGFGHSGAFLRQDPERIRAMVRLNCEAPAALARAFLPAMAARGRGGLVTVSSVAAAAATPWMSLYGATKVFDLHLSEGLAVELREEGVDVLALSPGHTATEFHAVAGVKGPVAGAPARPRAVAAAALDALGRRSLLVYGAGNRLLALGPRLVPRRLAARAAGRMLRHRARSGDQPPT